MPSRPQGRRAALFGFEGHVCRTNVEALSTRLGANELKVCRKPPTGFSLRVATLLEDTLKFANLEGVLPCRQSRTPKESKGILLATA